MAKIEFTGLFLRSFTGDRDKSGPYITIECTANYSKAVCAKMSWPERPEAQTKGDLVGELVAEKLILTPNQKLSKDQLELSIQSVSHFVFHVITNKDGESTRTELRFRVKTVEAKCAGLIEEFYRIVTPEAKGSMSVTYSEQKQLPLEEREEEAATAEA